METEANSQLYAISIMSKDRIGIISDVSQRISQLNGNIADIRQSVLCGYFSMILLVTFPSQVTQLMIETRLNEINHAREPKLSCSLRSISETIVLPTSTFPDNTYVLTVTGQDKVGFVATVTTFCAQNGINILDLSTTRRADEYVMILFIDLMQSQGVDSIRVRLKHFSESSGLRVVLQHYNIFRAVNEINLPTL
jgi:glycine cleavage system transcriptional repressor